jgi:flavin-binding protein dodecin
MARIEAAESRSSTAFAGFVGAAAFEPKRGASPLEPGGPRRYHLTMTGGRSAEARQLQTGRVRAMAGTYKMTELVGTSPVSFAEATKAAVVEAAKTIRHMDWFEVVQETGRIKDGQVVEFQVRVKIGFKIER